MIAHSRDLKIGLDFWRIALLHCGYDEEPSETVLLMIFASIFG